MNQLAQLAPHPDADQLSALLEDALSQDSREHTLAHLAVCAHCREIVALALAPIETQAEAAPEALASRTWASSIRRICWPAWRVALPIAAVACLLAATFLILRPDPRKQLSPAATSLTARSRPLDNLPPQSAPADHAQTSPAPQPTSLSAKRPAGPPAPNTVPTPSQAARPKPNPAPPPAAAPPPAPPAAVPVTLAAQAGADVPAPSPSRAFIGRPAAVLPQSPKAAPVHLGGAAGGALGAASGGAPRLASGPATVAGAPFAAPAIVTRSPLPGALPAISLAADGERLVALDSAHHAFFSPDSGRHWQPIVAPWASASGGSSNPVSVRFAVPPPARVQNGAMDGSFESSNAVLASEATIAEGSGTLAGIVTDSTGRAVAGATVRLTPGLNRPALQTTAGPDGHFQLTGVPAGVVHAEARAPGFAPQSVSIQLAAGQTSQLTLQLAPGSPSQTVSVDSVPNLTIRDEAAKLRTKTAPMPAERLAPPARHFELITDSGAHWISADGLHWTQH